MEYQKILILLEYTTNRMSKFKKKWVEINVEACGTSKFSLCNYSDAHILVKRVITAVGQETEVEAIAASRNDKKVIFENCAWFPDCII